MDAMELNEEVAELVAADALVDQAFGAGHSAKHPELASAVLLARAQVKAALLTSSALQNVADAIDRLQARP